MNNQMITEQLTNILNAMGMIETSGKNTLVMADCIRALDEVIQIMTQSAKDVAGESEPESPVNMQDIINEIGE